MAIVRDCGDFEAKIGFTSQINFTPPIDRPKMDAISAKYAKLSDELQALREQAELELLDWLCDQLGYPEDVVRKLVDGREAEEKRALTAETEGREKKYERRQKAGR